MQINSANLCEALFKIDGVSYFEITQSAELSITVCVEGGDAQAIAEVLFDHIVSKVNIFYRMLGEIDAYVTRGKDQYGLRFSRKRYKVKTCCCNCCC